MILLSVAAGPRAFGQQLPGTELLTQKADFADLMLTGMTRYLDRETATARGDRERYWHLDYSSREAYLRSVEANRQEFRRIIGVVDTRVAPHHPLGDAPYDSSAKIARGSNFDVYAVRWPALNGLDAEGLLLKPDRDPVARIVAVPDADQTPESLIGLTPGVAPDLQFARRLAENGALVLIPVLLDRSPTGIANPLMPRTTNQTHREFVYRMAYEMGRHVIGLEVQKILAAVDWMEQARPAGPIGVIGYGEGGLLALYASACDKRIQSTATIGYFAPREGLWHEPVYRNVWSLLRQFGDAEITRLVAPRPLAIQASPAPSVPGPPPISKEIGAGAAPGVIVPPTAEEVQAEFNRARPVYEKLGVISALSLGKGDELLWRGLKLPTLRALSASSVQGVAPVAADARQQRQFHQMVDYVEGLVHNAEYTRTKFWAKADSSSVERWKQSTQWYRDYLWTEIFGKLPAASEPLRVQTRQIYDHPKWRGYETVIPVLPDVFGYGILLVPKDLRPGERRAVVVAQHGRAARAQDMVEPETAAMAETYKKFAAQLADRGFIVYAPQNPYIFEERYRYIQRRANPLKLSLFSMILSQHERTLDWLSSLPFVDAERIGFYGLSYGGKTAVRVPTLLDRYALSICSGDFNEYTKKMAGLDMPASFMYTIEHEAYEFNLASTFNYSELAGLMAPRPFMVERGHNDGVGQDEWVAYEYAKLARFYARLGIPQKTTIEFFDGVHEIHLDGTLKFLEQHLKK